MTDAEKVYRQFEKEFLNTELDGEFCLFGEQLYLKPKCIDVDKIKVVRNGLNLGIYRKTDLSRHMRCVWHLKRRF